MDAQITIKFIVIVAICIIIMHEKIRELLKNNLSLDLSKSTYIKSAIGIALLSIICVTCDSSSNYNRSYNSQDSEKAKISQSVSRAYNSAQKEVKRQLKSPSTAKFASPFEEEAKYRINKDGSIYIQSYVDSQNSFGAIIRTNFGCTVDKYGNVKDLSTW